MTERSRLALPVKGWVKGMQVAVLAVAVCSRSARRMRARGTTT